MRYKITSFRIWYWRCGICGDTGRTTNRHDAILRAEEHQAAAHPQATRAGQSGRDDGR